MRDSLTVEIVRVRQENPEVTTLYFARPFDFMAGQYITVFIKGSQVREGKAYSISSRPSEELMSITVKNVGGEFSSYLCSCKVGDTLHISRAYGDFNPQTEQPLVGIAAGCGLSPIWSILADAKQPTFLYLSQKSPEYTVFAEELVASSIQVTKFSTPPIRHRRRSGNIKDFSTASEYQAEKDIRRAEKHTSVECIGIHFRPSCQHVPHAGSCQCVVNDVTNRFRSKGREHIKHRFTEDLVSDSDFTRHDIGQRIDKFGRRREKILFVANRFLIRRIGFERRAAVEEYDAHVFLRLFTIEPFQQPFRGKKAELRERIHLIKLAVVDLETAIRGCKEITHREMFRIGNKTPRAVQSHSFGGYCTISMYIIHLSTV